MILSGELMQVAVGLLLIKGDIMKNLTITERLIKLEVLMTNHLRHHEGWIKFFLFPILVLVSVSFILQLTKIIFTQ